MTDRTEELIREAFAAEADRAPDAREVAAALRRARRPRRFAPAIVAAATVVVVAAVAAVVIPRVVERSSGTPAAEQTAVTDLNVLLLGTDDADLTDTVVLAHLDADGTAAAVSVPRDSWVAGPGGEMTKLSGVYRQFGIDEATAVVETLTGVTVDHYAVLDETGPGALSTAVGGVPVCLAASTSDPLSGADFPAGEQSVAGDAAVAFLRQRHGLPSGDLDRITRHQVFLRGLIGKLDGAHLPTILDAVKDHFQVDPALDLVDIAQRVANAKSPVFVTVPIADAAFQTPDGGSAMDLDPAAVQQAVADAFAGAVPGQAPDATPNAGPNCVN